MRKKQVLAVLLCVMMTLSLAACGTKAEKTPTRTQGQGQKEDSDKKEESKEDAGQEDPDKPELPLCEAKEELSFWIPWTFAYLDSIDEVKNIQELEERTNVHINWVTPASQEANEKFGLMLASGDYPDILRGVNQYYPGGIEKGVDDGILVDMTDLIEQYMPHYHNVINLRKRTIPDTFTPLHGIKASGVVMNPNPDI